VPAALPSQYNADASHPLNSGYRLLASELRENESFKAPIPDAPVQTE